MKRKQWSIAMAICSVFTIILGASLKVWKHAYGETFLTAGLVSAMITVFIALPRDKSFLDRWLKD